MDMRIRKVLPDIEETLRSSREVVLSRVDLQSAQVKGKIRSGLRQPECAARRHAGTAPHCSSERHRPECLDRPSR